MKILLLISLLFSGTLFAEVGKVTKVLGGTDSYLVRGKENIKLSSDVKLERGDVLHSQNSYVVIQLNSLSQLSLAKNTEVKINTDIDFLKGIIRVLATKESLKIQGSRVAFSGHDSEFEVSLEDNQDVDLDVFKGEVEVTSPDVHTFVPEIVKANDGFRFEKTKKAFSRRRFAPKFRNHPGFATVKAKAAKKTNKKSK